MRNFAHNKVILCKLGLFLNYFTIFKPILHFHYTKLSRRKG